MNFVDGGTMPKPDALKHHPREYQPDLFDEPTSKSQSRKLRKEARKQKKATYQGKPLNPLNDRQKTLFDAFDYADQIFAVGEAGTGKTYILARMALRKLLNGEYEKLILTRPTVSDPRHRLGFLPGDAKKKLGPWLIPITAAFRDEVTQAQIEKLMQEGKIEYLPFEHMRGRSLSDCVVLLDEAQNCSFSDLRLFLTRKGEDSLFLINGDPIQIDIPDSGLETILGMINYYDLSPTVVKFEAEDVVRSAAAKEWVEAFKLQTESQLG